MSSSSSTITGPPTTGSSRISSSPTSAGSNVVPTPPPLFQMSSSSRLSTGSFSVIVPGRTVSPPLPTITSGLFISTTFPSLSVITRPPTLPPLVGGGVSSSSSPTIGKSLGGGASSTSVVVSGVVSPASVEVSGGGSSSSSSSHSPVPVLKNTLPKVAAVPVSFPSEVTRTSVRTCSPSFGRSIVRFPCSSIKTPSRGPNTCPLTDSPIASPPTKLPSSSNKGIRIGLPFASKETGILRSTHVPLSESYVITMGKGSVG